MQAKNIIFSQASYYTPNEQATILSGQLVNTPIGQIVVIGDDHALYYCDFLDNSHAQKKIGRLLKQAQAVLVQDTTAVMRVFEKELLDYFTGTLTTFSVPIQLFGTPFTQQVWRALQNIPYGTTISYTKLAAAIGKPTACRAVALANAANILPIVIPCHRVINSSGDLGGYNSGTDRKAWLLAHEKNYKQVSI